MPARISSADVQTARNWFRNQAKKVTDININTLFTGSKKNMVSDINTTSIGSMFHFIYDPKWKDKLPYYDVFPLSFIVELYSDGFLGINLHYLNPYSRAKLMDSLYTIALKENDTMKLQVSYKILKSATRFRFFQPCVKRYLSSHVRSRFLLIEPEQWDICLMLPTQRFVKSTSDVVWKDSRGMF